MDAIQEVEMISEGQMEAEEERGNEPNESNHRKENRAVKGFRPASLEVLDNVKINIEPETPISTLRGILMSSTSNLSFSKEELRKSEELMTKAFIEFYQKLRLLKSYWYNCFFLVMQNEQSSVFSSECLTNNVSDEYVSFMNQLAFSKIMKKYDKVKNRT